MSGRAMLMANALMANEDIPSDASPDVPPASGGHSVADRSHHEVLRGHHVTKESAKRAVEEALSFFANFRQEMSKSSEVLGEQAVTVLQQQLQRLSGLFKSSEASTIALESVLHALDSLYAALRSSATESQQLASTVRELKQQVAMLEKQHQVWRRQLLLGRVAYVLDQAAVSYVRYERQRATLGDLQKATKHNQLQPEQQQRWQEVLSFLSKVGMPQEDALYATGLLCRGNVAVAHGFGEEVAPPCRYYCYMWRQRTTRVRIWSWSTGYAASSPSSGALPSPLIFLPPVLNTPLSKF